MGLAGVCVGFALVIMDANVLNVAVAAMQAQLGASTGELLWTVDAYTLAFAALLLSTGLLGDRWGARRGFQAGLAVFTLGSVGCGLAPTVAALVAARVVQGAGAALLAPTSLALIYVRYPPGRARVNALGAWASVSGVAFAAGPLVGGALVQTLGWRAIFLLNVPVGVAAAVLVGRYVARTPGRPVRLNWTGQCLAAIALTAATAGLIEAGRLGWTAPAVLALFASAAAALAAFLLRERRLPTPLVPAEAVTSAPLRAGLLAGAAFNFAMYGSLFVYTLYLQHQRGYSALLTGLAFLPLTLLHTPVASWLARPWTAAAGPRRPLLAGLLCTVAGSVGFTVAAWFPYWVLAAALAVFGVGSGLVTTSMTTLVLAHVPGDSVGVSCGLLNAARQLGGVFGVALLGSLTAGQPTGRIPLAELCAVLALVAAVLVTATSPTPTGVRASGASPSR
ncbi:MFS transporter [Pseudonocardia acaciae]|uniref:MFS transporter n=1 Tax=Pseudonocardia acaciae TaxID=551276 RepID=UPI00048C9485|nr:MFS transporter [Pseudonocardia acaciae]